MKENKDLAAPMIARDKSPKNSSKSTPRIQRSFPVPDDKSIMICTLGGAGQIGMNWTLYGHKGRWVLVDAGSQFAPRDIDGVEAIFPDPQSLEPILSRLDAIIITHAHEDHIGAVHRLWPQIGCPIIATRFAAEVLKERFVERGTQGEVQIRLFEPGDFFKVGDFKIQTIRMTHSAPECVSLAFKTQIGTVFHSGDWKFDPAPMIGEPTDFDSLRKLGKEQIMAMVCESTNADRIGEITSEQHLWKGMRDVFADTPGMVAVTCFSTNIARIATIIRTAAASGRKVAVSGRSLIKNVEIARRIGLLDGVPPILEEARDLSRHSRRRTALICTGAQGEERAAFSRLALGTSRWLPKVKEGDAIVHSARAIPGNEEDIYRTFDRFREKGVTVHQHEYNGSPLHVTGHATGTEIGMMYDLVKPKYAITVHGEDHHMVAHAHIARAHGVRGVTVPREGDVLRVTHKGVELVAHVDVNLVAELTVEQGVFVDWDEELFRHIQETERAEELDEIFETSGQRMVA